MAVKTKDLLVNSNEFTSEDAKFDAKGKTALKIDGWAGSLDYIDAMEIVGDVLTVKLDATHSMSFENYKGLKYIKNCNGTLYNFIDAGKVQITDPVYPDGTKKNKTVKGTIYSDTIDARGSYLYDKNGLITDNSKKGFAIDGLTGNDTIYGSIYSDVIKGGDGDDEITGGKGNDTITGGKGTNTISHRSGDGNDTINLTKGENFILNLIDIESQEKIALGYKNKNKDVVVYTDKTNTDEYITLKNFGSKDVLNNATKKTADTSSAKIRFNTDDDSYTIDLKNMTVTSQATGNFTGTWLNDVINEKEYIAPLNGKNKGVTINGGAGNDEITGSNYSDKILSGAGDDIIYGTKGNDTITGGSGENKIIYCSLDELSGDRIYLTKGEQLNIDISHISGATATSKVSGKNLIVTVSDGADTKSFTIMNFGTKDVTNNSTKKQPDSSYVKLITSSCTTDLREALLEELKITKNYTGTWHSDNINAEDYKIYKTVKKGKIKTKELVTDTSKKGLTIKSGAGNDVIKGSNYSDNIYGGVGNDTLNAGTGNNCFYFNRGDGNDVIENGNGVDTLVFTNKTHLTYSYDKYDLIIKYSDKDTIRLKDYYKGHSVQYVKIGKKTTRFSPPAPSVKQYSNGEYNVFEGTYGTDDVIYTTKTNDIIYSGSGSNIYYFNTNGGKDVIYSGDGNDTIKFENEKNIDCYIKGNDLILLYEQNSTINLKNYFSIQHSVKTIINGNQNINISNFVSERKDSIPHIYACDNSDYCIDSPKNFDIIQLNGEHNLSYTKVSNSSDLIISYGNNTITVKNYFESDNPISIIKNGTEILDIANEIKSELCITASENEENIISTKNNDVIYLNNINHNIIYNSGDGNDTIFSGTANDTLTIKGRNLKDLHYTKKDNNIVISYNDDNQLTHKITLKDAITSIPSIKTIVADDGSISINSISLSFNLSLENAEFRGTNYNDTIDIGSCNATLDGGQGDNLYVINRPDGNYTIINGQGNDTIKFNFSGSIDSYVHYANNDDLIINYSGLNANRKTEKGTITLANYFKEGIHSANTIIKNGTQYCISDIVNNGIRIYGTDNANYINGTCGSDTIEAGKGNDIINAGKGNDTIYIIEGNNKLNFQPNDGNDTIYSGTGSDTIIINNSDEYNNIRYQKLSNDLIIRYTSNDSIRLINFFTNEHSVKEVQNGEYNVSLDNVKEFFADTTNSYIVVGTENSDIYSFKSGDGHNTIINSSSDDKIKIEGQTNLKFAKDINNGNLDIYYTKSDYITIKNYFVDNQACVDAIINGEDENNISDLINTQGIGYKYSQGNYVIENNEEISFICFYTNAGRTYTKNLNSNDLIISNGQYEVTVKDYFKENGSHVKNIYENGEEKDISDLIKNGLTIVGSENSEEINGTDNVEIIKSVGGNDTINAGKGNDYIYGGSGNSTFTFTKDDGHDYIYSGTGEDTIEINGVDFEDLSYTKSNNNLIINYDDNSSITLINFFSDNHSVKYLKLGDEVATLDDKINNLYQTTNSNIIYDTKYDDIIHSSNKDTTVYLTGGDDKLYLERTYYGTATIYCENGNKEIIISKGSFDDISFQKDQSSHDLIIKSSKNYYGQIILKDYFKNSEYAIKYITAGGERKALKDLLPNSYELTGTDSADVIMGTTYVDTITPKKGADTIYLNSNNNKIIFSSGDGNDTIYSGTGEDEIIINNVSFNDITYYKNGSDSDLYINYGSLDNIILKDYFSNEHSVKYITINDETRNITDELTSLGIVVNNGITMQGTQYNDTINVFNNNYDNITVNGGAGENTIIKVGLGTLTVENGEGTDTVWIKDGSNYCSYSNFSSFYADGDDLICRYHLSLVKEQDDDIVVLKDYFKNHLHSVQYLKLDDLEARTLDSLFKTLDIRGTDGDDVIDAKNYNFTKYLQGGIKYGSIYGGAGNDTIYGTDNSDKIYGGDGNDVIYSSEGDDFISTGNGNDIVYCGTGENTVSAFGSGYKQIHCENGTANIETGTGVNHVYLGENSTVKCYGDVNIKSSTGNNTYEINNSTKSLTITDIKAATIKFKEDEVIKIYKDRNIIYYNNEQNEISFNKKNISKEELQENLKNVTIIIGDKSYSYKDSCIQEAIATQHC